MPGFTHNSCPNLRTPAALERLQPRRADDLHWRATVGSRDDIERQPDGHCGIRYRATAIVTLSLPPFFRAAARRTWQASLADSARLSTEPIVSLSTMSVSPSVHNKS